MLTHYKQDKEYTSMQEENNQLVNKGTQVKVCGLHYNIIMYAWPENIFMFNFDKNI